MGKSVIDKANPDSTIEGGISIINKDAWYELTSFFSFAEYDTPTTEKKMRTRVGLSEKLDFKSDFQKTVDLYVRLKNLAEDFDHDVVEASVSLADDIVHYNTLVQSTFPRLYQLIDKFIFDGAGDDTQEKLEALMKLWKAGKVEGRSEKIREYLEKSVRHLADEASKRRDRAHGIHDTIMAPSVGVHPRLKALSQDFTAQAEAFDKIYGANSATLKKLTADIKAFADELKALRKKEKDEVIVLSTSPLYLAIPIFGPFILAGVDIGVGIDLANVRAKISAKEAELNTAMAEMATDTQFSLSYTLGKSMSNTMASKIDEVAPNLKALASGWERVSSDLTFIADQLSKEGVKRIKDDDWFDFQGNIDAAQKQWDKVGERADKFRHFAIVKAA